MAIRLTSADGEHVFELRRGAPLVLGRSLSSDLPLLDPTISRRHAELTLDGDAVSIRDLGSSNGTFVNGVRVEGARVVPGDVLAFGRVVFSVKQTEGTTPSAPLAAPNTPTIVRERRVPNPTQSIAEVLKASGTQAAITAAEATDEARVRQKLSLLLELSKALTRSFDIDALLSQVADYLFQILDVDRASVLLADEAGDLVPRVSRDRAGTPLGRTVPMSIARRAVEEKVAIQSDNAPLDRRFSGESVVAQQVRSAVCVPLVSSENAVLGVLYVDSISSAHRLGEDDLDFLVAFAGIVAIAIENSQLAERIRREALVRSNFERYFTPLMAERIARETGALRLGGERRKVAVLFSDIRGFTPIAAAMAPDDTARLLSEYFTEMVECVFRHGGTLDKFMGDAVMAQWGAPITEADDADRALEASVDMMHSLEVLNARWRERGDPELRIGIGLNYGDAFAGNIGSERRLEFTVIGDTVNTAHRLCAWAEGGEIILSDDFRRALVREHRVAERPALKLRGKAEPVAAWRVER